MNALNKKMAPETLLPELVNPLTSLSFIVFSFGLLVQQLSIDNCDFRSKPYEKTESDSCELGRDREEDESLEVSSYLIKR